jgi:hypothetical protein
MSTETTATRPPRRTKPEEVSIDTIPMHPPITKDGLHDEALKEWFMEHYPSLAAYLYTGRIINPDKP